MSFTGKRSAEDSDMASPAKKLKEYFHEGYMQYGEGWANEQFAAAAQQGVLEQVQGDDMLAEVPEQNTGPADTEVMTMEVDAQKEEEWWQWWSNKWKPQVPDMMVPDCLGR